MPTSLITAMDLRDCAPGLVDADGYDAGEALRDAIEDADRCFPKIARGLFDKRDWIEDHITYIEKHGGDATALHRAKDHLEQLGAIFQATDFNTLPLASQAFADSWGDFNNALAAIQKAKL